MIGLLVACDCRADSLVSSSVAVKVHTPSSRLDLSWSTRCFLAAVGLPVPAFAAPMAFTFLVLLVALAALAGAQGSLV
ncbi:hypothetical protein Ae201684P_008811 [Aphanomyces euteiches]|nr:hypothetical protein Ae201684P_008811 [Aphanomyces euteiches]